MASVTKRPWTYNGVTKEAWCVRYLDPSTGKRPSKQFEKKKDADAFKRKVEREIEDGIHITRSATNTVEAVTAEWMAAREAMHADGRLARASIRNDRGRVSRYVVPKFGARLVRDLAVNDVDAWIRELRAGGLSAKTTKDTTQTLAQVLDFAVRRRYAAMNVAREVKAWAEHRQAAAQPIRTFTVDDVRALLEWARPRDLGLLVNGKARPREGWSRRSEALARCSFFLAAFCGMRMGEIFGLTHEHLDLASGTLLVRHSLDAWGNLKGPKTRAGIRDLHLPAVVVEELQAWVTSHYVENERGLVFTGKTGAQVHHATFYRNVWQPALAGAGLSAPDDLGRRFHFHALRHFAASMLIGGGVPLPDVAAMMGHKSFDVTLQVYAHPLMNVSRKRTAVDAIADTFRNAPGLTDATQPQIGLNY